MSSEKKTPKPRKPRKPAKRRTTAAKKSQAKPPTLPPPPVTSEATAADSKPATTVTLDEVAEAMTKPPASQPLPGVPAMTMIAPPDPHAEIAAIQSGDLNVANAVDDAVQAERERCAELVHANLVKRCRTGGSVGIGPCADTLSAIRNPK